MKFLVRHLVRVYRKLPVKPFQGLLEKLYLRYKLLRKNTTVIAEIDEIKYQLDLNELIDSSIYYEGCFEPPTTELIKRYVKPEMTVVDIGANMGCHTLRMAKLVGEKGRVIAFEPMSWPAAKLRRNIELNSFNNISVERIGLSNARRREENIYFRTSWTLDGGSAPDSMKKESIDLMTLDEYVKEHNIQRIDFIKIDVDGYEYKAIQGARETLKRDKPLILIELGSYTLREAGDDISELVNTLSGVGYKFISENTLAEFPDTDTMIKSIPENETINVLCKCG